MTTRICFSALFVLSILGGIIHPSDPQKKIESVTVTALDSSKSVDYSECYDQTLIQLLPPASIRSIIKSYLHEDSHRLSRYINLTEVKMLSSLFAPEFQTEKHIDAGLQIARRIYEAPPRSVKSGYNAYSGSWGFTFPVEPEALAYAMQLAKNEIVLEIAGASGENAIMLAFAGAERVYLNDISAEEIKSFSSLKTDLPSDVSKRLESLSGNCLDLVKRSDLRGKFGLIICRNLIHFFTDKQQVALFQLIKQLLKPGGRAFFTANATYWHKEHREFFEKNPHATCFATSQCLLTDLTKGPIFSARFFYDISTCADTLLEQVYRTHYIYERVAQTNYMWKANTADFKKLDAGLKQKVKKACKDNDALIKNVVMGTVRILLNWLRLYSAATITELFDNHGFEVEETYMIGAYGHVIHEDPCGTCKSIGIIVKVPN